MTFMLAMSDTAWAPWPCRAERFGTIFVDPANVRPEFSMEAKMERLKREGFVTGFDTLSSVS